MAPQRVPIKDRFWNKVEKTDTCWIWKASISSDGYGKIHFRERGGKDNQFRAHRISWELTNGPITNGLSVLHRCDNRLCVNPDHLFLGTLAENCLDMFQKGRARCNRKLTQDQVDEIKRRYIPRKVSVYTLAKEYNVSPSAVSCIIRGERWGKTH